ncbi:MAG: hypothetical protein ACM3NZ_11805, partial [Betaproteobacteria bacterium]
RLHPERLRDVRIEPGAERAGVVLVARVSGDRDRSKCFRAIVDVRPEGEGIVVGDVDRSRIAEVRARLPALSHRSLA